VSLSLGFGLLLRDLVAIRVPLKRSKSVMRRYAKVLAAPDARGALAPSQLPKPRSDTPAGS